MIPKWIHRRTAASAFVLALILLSSSFSIATISSVGRHSTGSHALPSQATSVTQNIGNIKELLQISTNNLYTSVPQSAYAIGVPVTAFYNDQSGYVDFLGGWAPSLLAFDTKTNLVHSVQILTETSPGTLISESLDPNNDLLYIVRTLLGLANGGFPYAGPYTTGGTSDLVIVNATTGQTVTAIPLVEPAMGVTYDPANSNVYVTLQGNGGYGPAVAVVDTRSNSLSGLIPIPSSSPVAQTFAFLTFISIPRLAGITYDPGNGYLYVGTINSNSIFVINGATNSLVTTIQSPSPDYNPESIAYDPANGILYVSVETGVGIAINGW